MQEDESYLASLVASQYELVRRILETLPESSLDACEKVNTLWYNAVKAERNSCHRRVIQMFSWKGKAQSSKVKKRRGKFIHDILIVFFIAVLFAIWSARL